MKGQEEAKIKLSKYKVGALFMDAGTGKTKVAVELANSVPYDKVFYFAPIRLINPKDGITSIKDEVAKWGGFKDVTYCGIESLSASDRIYLNVRSEISKCYNPFAIVDESIKVKNIEAKRTKRMIELSKMFDYKLILNGTPMTRNLLDLKPQMDFLSPLILNMTDNEFKDTFCEYTTITKRFGNKKYQKEFVTGHENIDYLYNLIGRYVYECDLSLNVKQRYHDIEYTISEEERKEYNSIKEWFLSDETLEWRNNNIFLEMTQKMQHSYCCAEDKFIKLDELFKTVDESKSIIYCKYVSSREECQKRYKKAVVLSYQKESLGLNLQSYNNTIYFDKIWDYGLMTQASRRTYRTGQEFDCNYYNLTGNVGLESLINKNIEKKISMTEYFKGTTKKQIIEVL